MKWIKKVLDTGAKLYFEHNENDDLVLGCEKEIKGKRYAIGEVIESMDDLCGKRCEAICQNLLFSMMRAEKRNR